MKPLTDMLKHDLPDTQGGPPMRDRFGNALNIGDFVIYGRNLGRCATTALGRIVEFREREPDYFWPERTPLPKVVLATLQDDQGLAAQRKSIAEAGRIKRITIQESQRLVKYSADLVSSEIRELFWRAMESDR